MWIYGDAERTSQPQALAGRVAANLERMAALPNGLGRHAAIIAAFVDASELIQGLIDAAFHERGFDASTHGQSQMTAVLYALAGTVEQSWRSHFAEQDVSPTLLDGIAALGQDHPGALTTRSAEGYSLYALYPETYVEAAYRSGLGRDTIVIGIRSIGLSLAALVAAALGSRPPISLRPVGDPFARKIHAEPQLLRSIAHPEVPIAIVDEGPGLSGSSFFAVADWLEGGGVARDRIHFFPSHDGAPGRQATDNHRQRWRQAPRHLQTFDTAFSEERGLERWITGLLGPLKQPLQELSGGAWRRVAGERSPVDARLERCKILAHAEKGSFLVKFAGLGSEGTRKFGVAQDLFQAGFAVEPIALLHGMIVERWVDSTPLAADVDRSRLVDTLARYLAFRATTLPTHNKGAPLTLLAEVAAFNAGRAFGHDAEMAVRLWTRNAAAMQAQAQPADTDNRLHRWEWRVLADGRLIKTDALDHSSSHDLVGCQDIGWDVAGAIVEHDLTKEEASQLIDQTGGLIGRALHPDLIKLFTACYIGFQAGLWTMALEAAVEESKPAIRDLLRGYRRRLLEVAASDTLSQP